MLGNVKHCAVTFRFRCCGQLVSGEGAEVAKDTIAELHIEDRLSKLNQKLEAINDHVRELKNAVGKRNCPEDIKLRSVHCEIAPRASN